MKKAIIGIISGVLGIIIVAVMLFVIILQGIWEMILAVIDAIIDFITNFADYIKEWAREGWNFVNELFDTSLYDPPDPEIITIVIPTSYVEDMKSSITKGNVDLKKAG